ncbi:GDSL esterase/lipase At1g29670-like [Telopea speciosissima]|uniref:GDSL esterase/lipase At1g29670-like n=1 Tax=Telopea speciosissima TaxID=54955 RepID=UPI001CC519FE|nr:GDSL esterase/lipase At1g29670-like [Telopea speciosissima]
MTQMGKKAFSSNLLVFFFFIFLPSLLLCSCCDPACKEINRRDINGAETNGLFVFGSSLVDNGNNNFLKNSTSRADYLPYGIDFPLGPTGRFSNGKNVIDELGELLKLPSFIPSFKNPTSKGHNILHGVNFASGGSGILDDTGSISGCVITLRKQIRNYQKVTLRQLAHQLGRGSKNSLISSGILSKYLFVIGTGGNDYLLNYFLRNSTSSASLEAFTANLIRVLSMKLKKLYSLGARKFVLISIYPIGCIPVVKTKFRIRQGCILPLNQAASLFNSELKSLVDVIKPDMPGSNLVYVNSYKIIDDIIEDPNPRGFKDTSNACCEVSVRKEGGSGVLCKRGGNTCGDRNSHVFFDGLHPTEAVNKLIAKIAYASSFTVETYPINVKELAKL